MEVDRTLAAMRGVEARWVRELARQRCAAQSAIELVVERVADELRPRRARVLRWMCARCDSTVRTLR